MSTPLKMFGSMAKVMSLPHLLACLFVVSRI